MMSKETYHLAESIVNTLKQKGYIAYFAGGWVRDFLMGHPSDDIDIATDAPPEKILDLFPVTIKVGIAFGVVIVSMKGHSFEVATFRKDIDYVGGRKPTRIEPAKPQEDAKRRDFTINGIYFDPSDNTLHDFVGGREDIQKGIIRTIGDPNERFTEDRLRMIRAIRFAARFQFHIDIETEKAIQENAISLFPAVSIERIWSEFEKMAKRAHFDFAILEMARLGLLKVIFPELASVHLNEIKSRIASFSFFPKNSPTIAYFMELFPEKSLQDIMELCRYLKTSNREISFAEQLYHCKRLVKEGNEDSVEWSYVYVHPNGKQCLGIIAARYSESERKRFLEMHEKREQQLSKAIQRIRERTPVVSSKDLEKEGVVPGKTMGILLKEAEKIATNCSLEDPQEVLKILKTSPLWPK